jgi:hypothetical protein
MGTAQGYQQILRSYAPMTDPIVPEPTPTPAAPAYAPAPVAGVAAKRALSLTSFILGLAGVILFWTTWFAILVGIAAVVLGFIGRSREPGAPKWMSLVGIIAGFVAIVLGVIILIVALAFAASISTLNVN